MAYLSSYKNIRSHLLIELYIPEYKVNSTDIAAPTIVAFSDLNRGNRYTYNGVEFAGLGSLLSVTSSNNELRPTSTEMTITITGLGSIVPGFVINSKLKGCPIVIYRLLFDPITGEPLEVYNGNPFAKFSGVVNNYGLNEEYDVNSRTSNNTISLICKSDYDYLQNKITGRFTNPTSEKSFYPADLSMDRVPALQNTSFNFGAPL